MPTLIWNGSEAVRGRLYQQRETGLVPVRLEPVQPGYSSISEMLNESPFYIAHRGASANWPEMSLLAYTRSVAWGAGALEFSVARTSDGVYFGLHDEDLLRTSGVATKASAMTWAQVQALNISVPQGVAPYMRIEELAALYGNSHILFIEPKYIHRLNFQNEFYAKIKSVIPAWQQRVVIKLYWEFGPSWASTARSAGFQTWGYFWDDDGYPSRASYHQNFTILGFNYDASQANWTQMLSIGKPVIGHVCLTPEAAATALSKGASGIMTGDVVGTIPPNGPFKEAQL